MEDELLDVNRNGNSLEQAVAFFRAGGCMDGWMEECDRLEQERKKELEEAFAERRNQAIYLEAVELFGDLPTHEFLIEKDSTYVSYPVGALPVDRPLQQQARRFIVDGGIYTFSKPPAEDLALEFARRMIERFGEYACGTVDELEGEQHAFAVEQVDLLNASLNFSTKRVSLLSRTDLRKIRIKVYEQYYAKLFRQHSSDSTKISLPYGKTQLNIYQNGYITTGDQEELAAPRLLYIGFREDIDAFFDKIKN